MTSRKIVRKKNSFMHSSLIISVIILFSVLIVPVHIAANTSVKVDPLSKVVSPGSTFTLDVLCIPTTAIKSFELRVAFNPSLLSANSVTKGTIFSGHSTFFNAGTIDNTAGTIRNVYDVILGTGSVSSSGTLVRISFTAKSTTGTSSINLNNVGITNNVGYIPITITNGSVQITQQTNNNPPVYEYMTPANQSTNVPITTTALSLTIRDPNGDSFDYTIQTKPNVGSVSVTGAKNGTKQCTISGLQSATTYRWYVNATDGVSWKRRWYTFTTAPATANNPVVFSGVTPSNGSTNIPITTSSISLMIRDPEGKSFSYTIQTRPNVGSRSQNGVYNGTKSCAISGLSYGTTYRWYVNATDGSSWTRRWYTFTTVQAPTNSVFIFSNVNPSNGSTNVPLSTSRLSLMIQNSYGHAFDYTITTVPDVGSKVRTNYYNGTKTCDISGLAYGTTYRWYVSCRDVSTGLRATHSYWFTTEYDYTPGSPPSGGGDPPSGGEPPTNETPPPSGQQQNTPPNPPKKPAGPTFIEVGMSYYFISSAFDSDSNDTIRLRFDWGDGNYSNWTGFVSSNVTASLSHSWRNASSYNISVIAQDTNGQNSSWSEPLTVIVSQLNPEEEVLLEIQTSLDNITTHKLVQFDASNSVVPGRTIISYFWEFGDGNASAGKTTTHTYLSPGEYTVTLEITDHLGEIYHKKVNVAVVSAAQIATQQEDTNLLSVFLSIMLIGLIVALVFFLLVFTGKKIPLGFMKKFAVSGIKLLLQVTRRIPRIKRSVVKKPIAHHKPEQERTNLEVKSNVTNTMNVSAHPAPSQHVIHSNDAIELDYIHDWIDKINF